MMLPKSSQWGPLGYKWLVWLLLVQSLTASLSFVTRADSGSPPPNYLDKLWRQVVPGVWYTTIPLSQNPPITEEPQVMGASLPTPSLFHPLASFFLLSYLGAYFLLGRFDPLLGQYRLIGELFHMGMVSFPIGSLITGLNPSAAIHLLGGMFPSRWVPETLHQILPNGDTVPYALSMQKIDTILIYHRDLGHTHSRNLHEYLKTRYWWSNMLDDIKAILEQCEVCEKYA
ncbi:hypothetical protein DSO57_1021114 [Entomophthora muscae]|uniref:Uncharacterized protein n=1 Tax=Entomophthora muscae TaxID=34485 RepID=A0ACC2UPD8_9FUNG|nr:hypothetical protein DSO57_1021114 [Entomophthora muscae]